MGDTPPTFEQFLTTVQKAVDGALQNAKQNVSGHVAHPPFQFGYIRGDNEPNASAISIGGCSFIFITEEMVRLLLHTCQRLGSAESVADFSGVPTTPARQDAIYAVMFQVQLAFVVSHEYTHHVHGHTTQGTIGNAGGAGENLQRQAAEIDADGYAVFHVLAHFIDGEGRAQAIKLLCCDQMHPSEQDDVLLSLVIMALGSLLFVTDRVVIEPADVYNLQHPPQAVRMEFITRNVMRWIRLNRSALEARFTLDRFRMQMMLAARATWGMNGVQDWDKQIVFFTSKNGSKYVEKLEELVTTLIKS
jgi:hypothetical protein